MTDPPLPAHPDDEALSALVDGEGPAGADDHLAGCPACTARVASLRAARERVAAAAVPPLSPAVVDRLVATALAVASDAPASAGAGPPDAPPRGAAATSRRGRRITTPPPAWILGAVAAVAVVAGMAGLLRAGPGGSDGSVMANGSDASTATQAVGESSAETGTASALAVDAAVVTVDLGEVGDVSALTRALNAEPVVAGRLAPTAGGGAGSDTGGRTPAAATPPPPAGDEMEGDAAGAATADAPAGPPDRAQCRAEAERLGAGRLGALLTAATLRWSGRPAEVLVFALTEPAGGVSRQALVLSRPGCELLADPRF